MQGLIPDRVPNSTVDRTGCDTAGTRKTRRRTWTFRLIACGLPTLAGTLVIVWILIAQERLVFDSETHWPRLQSPPIYLEEPGHEVTGHRYLYDPLLGWRNIPGWNATSLGRNLTINSRGLRDKEYSYEARDGVSRILVLGDSYVWGYGVEDNEIFTEVLEDQLRGKSPSWEVINTGVSGWGTDQELLFLQTEGFRYGPDIVVLAFFLMNDPFNNVQSTQYGLHKPVFMDTDLTLANHPVPTPSSRAATIDVTVDPIKLTCAIIGEIQRECRNRDCELVIMKFGRFLYGDHPHAVEFEGRFEEAMSSVEHPYFLDLDDAFGKRASAAERLLEGNNDGHWNAYGHRVTAEILHEFLIETGLVR